MQRVQPKALLSALEKEAKKEVFPALQQVELRVQSPAGLEVQCLRLASSSTVGYLGD